MTPAANTELPSDDDRHEEATADVLRSRRHVASLRHGLMILDMFTRNRQQISIGEMSAELKLHKSSASRLAATLAFTGYLHPTGVQGSYRLGGRLSALGHLAVRSLDLLAIVVPHLEQLTLTTGETGHLAVLHGTNAHTEAVTDGWHSIRMHSWAGKLSPAYVSSMGKALLAGLGEGELRKLYRDETFEQMTENTVKDVEELLVHLALIRARGYGFDNEELEIGMRCISAPIVSSAGVTVASISISGPTQRITDEVVPELAQHVRWHAASASRDLGALPGVPEQWPPPPGQHPPRLSYLVPRETRPR